MSVAEGPVQLYQYAGQVLSGQSSCILTWDPISAHEGRASTLQVIVESITGDSRATDLLISDELLPLVSTDSRTGGGRRIICGGQVTRPTYPFSCRYSGAPTLTLRFVDVDENPVARTSDTTILLTVVEIFST